MIRVTSGTSAAADVADCRRVQPPHSTPLCSVLVVVVVATAGCIAGGSGPPGDPGNYRLHQLRADPIFSSLSPGAQLTQPLQEIPARYRAPGLDGGGECGPAVVAAFSSSQQPEAVFAFYARRAALDGWTPTGSRNVLGYPQAWEKPYPGHISASLGLRGDVRTAPGPSHIYTLVADLPSRIIR